MVNKDKKNIHEHSFVNIPKNWENKKLNDKWDQLFSIKQEANIAIEAKRSSKEIGSSLEAEVKLSVNQNIFDLLKNIDLAEYLITSKAEKVLSEDKEMKIQVNKAKGNKCPRCWKILEQSCDRCSSLI